MVDAAVEVLGLLLPVACLGCGAPGRAVCRSCRAVLRDTPGSVRLVAGVRLDAAFAYDGLVRVLLLELKLRGRVDVAGPLGRPTGVLVRRALAAHPGSVVLRVPSSRSGARRRGFDPVVLLLARGGVRGTGRLRRVRRPVGPAAGSGSERHGQKERSGVERVAATVGTLRAVGVAGRRVVLVDDVVTTGVTVAEAVRAVRAAGGSVVRCVATASVDEGLGGRASTDAGPSPG